MADTREDETLFLVDPPMRGILPLDQFHLPSRLARTIRKNPYRITIDTAFDTVIALCAETAHDRPSTWISLPIERLYLALFARGLAHSVEVWLDEQLVGGLYGVCMGGVFFGESMVSRATDASKIALTYLVARLRQGQFTLLDCQFMTRHLQQFGTIEIPRDIYRQQLRAALSKQGDFYAMASQVDGQAICKWLSEPLSAGGINAPLAYWVFTSNHPEHHKPHGAWD